MGATLAFYQWPLLSVVFSFIPVIGPILGVVGAVVMGGLLYWANQNKSSKKFGSLAEEMLDLDCTLAQINRLEAEHKSIKAQWPTSDKKLFLKTAAKSIDNQLNVLYRKIETVEPRYEAELSDWASPTDRMSNNITTVGGFLCAFSGVLGILGVVLAPIPVAGWVALGVALLVGVAAAGVFYYKSQNSIVEYGKAREKIHEKKYKLSQKKDEYLARIANARHHRPVPFASENQEMKSMQKGRPDFHAAKKTSELLAIRGSFRPTERMLNNENDQVMLTLSESNGY